MTQVARIRCPYCNKEFEITEALKHQIEEELSSTIEEKYKVKIEQAREEATKEATQLLNKDLQEERERNRKLLEELNKLLDEVKKLRVKDADREVEMKKRLLEEEEKLRMEISERMSEEYRIKDMEKEKIIQDLRKSLDEARRKAQQGSQQTQGESLELELEKRLKTEFPMDEISEIKKGQRGADIRQEVFDKLGRRCGVILWESKNAKWQDEFISKLKEDQRQAKADIAVIVSVNLPKNISMFGYVDGVWVCGISTFIPLATALRFTLVSLNHERQSIIGMEDKAKSLMEYMKGSEFRLRIEGIVESFTRLQEEIEREKRWFQAKWARQEKAIRRVIDHTHGMYGELQAVMGKSLPDLKELESGENTE